MRNLSVVARVVLQLPHGAQDEHFMVAVLIPLDVDYASLCPHVVRETLAWIFRVSARKRSSGYMRALFRILVEFLLGNAGHRNLPHVSVGH